MASWPLSHQVSGWSSGLYLRCQLLKEVHGDQSASGRVEVVPVAFLGLTFDIELFCIR